MRKETVKKHINLELSSVLGMGAVGPVLAVLTATTYSAFGAFVSSSEWAYPALMLFLSGLAAVFPVVKSGYSKAVKVAMWPLAAVVIFASAWTSSTGMSAAEEKVRGPEALPAMAAAPAGVPMAPVSSGPKVMMMVAEPEAYNVGEGRATRGRFFRRLR